MKPHVGLPRTATSHASPSRPVGISRRSGPGIGSRPLPLDLVIGRSPRDQRPPAEQEAPDDPPGLLVHLPAARRLRMARRMIAARIKAAPLAVGGGGAGGLGQGDRE